MFKDVLYTVEPFLYNGKRRALQSIKTVASEKLINYSKS